MYSIYMYCNMYARAHEAQHGKVADSEFLYDTGTPVYTGVQYVDSPYEVRRIGYILNIIT